jgi:hypothetical protein
MDICPPVAILPGQNSTYTSVRITETTSVLDAMSPNCANREKPKAMTAADLAFLKALYYRNYVYGPSPSRATIEYSMMQQFKGPPL